MGGLCFPSHPWACVSLISQKLYIINGMLPAAWIKSIAEAILGVRQVAVEHPVFFHCY